VWVHTGRAPGLPLPADAVHSSRRAGPRGPARPGPARVARREAGVWRAATPLPVPPRQSGARYQAVRRIAYLAVLA
jgi:hypothetical protein